MTSPLLRPRDVARLLVVSEQTVRNLARAGVLRAVTFKSCGSKWTVRFRAEDVEEFVTGNLRDGKAAR
jgi:excisionase family DNA binding protein